MEECYLSRTSLRPCAKMFGAPHIKEEQAVYGSVLWWVDNIMEDPNCCIYVQPGIETLLMATRSVAISNNSL